MEFTITSWQTIIACGARHYCTMNFIPQYSTNSGEHSVGVHMGADMACISKRGACQITWMCNMCQNDTGGVSSRYGSVECQHSVMIVKYPAAHVPYPLGRAPCPHSPNFVTWLFPSCRPFIIYSVTRPITWPVTQLVTQPITQPITHPYLFTSTD